MTSILPYLGLLAGLGVLLLLLAFTLVLLLEFLTELLERQSHYLLAGAVSTIAVVVPMGLFGAVTAAAVERSTMHLGIATALVALVMFASGLKQSVLGGDDSALAGGAFVVRFAQVLLGLIAFGLVAIFQPTWLQSVGHSLLGLVRWLFGVPILGWVARVSGGLFVLWSIGQVVQLLAVMALGSVALARRS